MSGLFVGTMPVQSWLDDYVKQSRYTDARKPPTLDLSKVPIPSIDRCRETSMYQPFCDAVNKSKVCPGFTLVDVSKWGKGLTVDKRELDPDLMLFANEHLKKSKEAAWAYCEVIFELKPFNEDSGFCDEAGKPLEKQEGKSPDTRAQLCDYAANLFSIQQRCFVFVVEVCGEYVRFLRWDRAGCTVAARFSWRKNPEILASFLHRLSKLDARDRGHDTTAIRASPENFQKLKDAVEDFVGYCQTKGWNAEHVRNTLAADHVPYVVTVGTRKVVINKPFFQAKSVCGRATRVYAAYDLESKELCALKDAWRTNSVGVQSEEEIYQHLEANGVRWLATTYFVGDVMESGSLVTDKQITHTDTMSSPTFKPWWKKDCNVMRSLIHTRVLQELGLPLQSMANSKEVVLAMRNALECAYDAREKAGTCHRDISIGNVLVNKRGEGFLNDWDHGQILELVKTPHQYRTGTWQFVSVDFLQEPRKPHNIQDDVESSFWVLLYACLHFIRHNCPTFDLTFFDEQHLRMQDNTDEVHFGGALKVELLTRCTIKNVDWDCVPLKNLLIKFSDLLGDYHGGKERPAYQEMAQASYAKIGNSQEMLGLFKLAMEQEGWLSDDRVDDQIKPKPAKKQERDRNKAAASQRAEGAESLRSASANPNQQGGPEPLPLKLPSSLTGWSTPPDTDGLPRPRRRPTRYNNAREVIHTSRGSSKRSMPIEQPEDDDDDEEEPQAGPSNRPNHPAKRARQSKKTKKTKGQPSTGNAAASGSAPRRLDRTSSDVSTGSTGKGRRASGRVSRQPSRRSNRLRSQGSK